MDPSPIILPAPGTPVSLDFLNMLTRDDFEAFHHQFEIEYEIQLGTFQLMAQTRGLLEHVAQRYAEEDEANTDPDSLPF